VVQMRAKRAKDVNYYARANAVGEAPRRSMDWLTPKRSPARPKPGAIPLTEHRYSGNTCNDRVYRNGLVVSTAEVTDVQ
jgi:hypothetical protein